MKLPTPGALKAWFMHRLDEDSVRQWIAPYCAVWITWAILAIFKLPPVSLIEDAMGHSVYVAWLWIAIYANGSVIAGLWMRHGGSAIANMSTPLLLRDWMGLFSQASGHIMCSGLLLMFEVSAIIGARDYDGPNLYAGVTIFCAFMLLPWTLGTAFLCAQCLRKVQKGLQLERSHFA